MTGKKVRKMDKNYAFIWDLDGTLLDSYGVIVSSMRLALEELGVRLSEREILEDAIGQSIRFMEEKIQRQTGIPAEAIQERYSRISKNAKLNIGTMENAEEILRLLRERGIKNYVFTHRGATTMPVLSNLGLTDCFDDIVTSQDGFPRKPQPDAILYLLEKHGLEPARTFYVGDRSIDMECARNAGIAGILYIPPQSVGQPTGAETWVIRDLLEIQNILS